MKVMVECQHNPTPSQAVQGTEQESYKHALVDENAPTLLTFEDYSPQIAAIRDATQSLIGSIRHSSEELTPASNITHAVDSLLGYLRREY